MSKNAAPFAVGKKRTQQQFFIEKPSHSFLEPQWHEVVTTAKWLFQIAAVTPASFLFQKAFGVDVDKKWPIKATHFVRSSAFFCLNSSIRTSQPSCRFREFLFSQTYITNCWPGNVYQDKQNYLRNRTNYPKNKSINYDLFGIWFLFLCTNGNLHIVFSWYLVEVDTTSLQKIVLPSLLIGRLTFHSARKMRTYENICFCYGKITYQSALKSYFAQIVELVNKKSDPSNFQRFRNQDQFCLNNGLYPSRTYSK